MKTLTHNAPVLDSLFSSMGINGLPTIHSDDEGRGFENGRVLAYNASQFSSNVPEEFLSNYAGRYTDPLQASLDDVSNMLAPEIQAGNRLGFVQYPVYLYEDAFKALDNANDDLRGVGQDFPTLRNTSKNMVTAKITNRGLAIEVDEDEELLDGDWQQRKVAYLMGIMSRTRLRRTLALFVAIATAVAKTWDTTPGKDPDMDLLAELENSPIRQTRAIFGPGAATKRKMSLRSQNTPAGYGNSGYSDNDLAGFLSMDSVMTVRNRVTTGAGTTSTIFGNYVLLFIASQVMQKDDFSNLKTFTGLCKNGARYAVYVRQIGDKRWRIAVEKYEIPVVTSTIGAEVLTIS